MAKTKTYKVGNDVYDIPENETKDFLSNFSDAIEVESFIVDKDTYDIPLAEIQEFKTQFPTAQPLKKKASTEPIQPDLGSGGTVGASDVQSTESEVFKPKRIGETQIEGEAVDIFQYPKTEVTESPFTDELKATLKRLPTEALVAANEIKKLKRKPTPQELQGIQDKYGITKPEEVDALTKYLEFGLKGEKTVEPSTIDYLSNAWQRGTNNARLSSYINMGRMPSEEELKTIAEINRFELPTSKITERFNNAPDLNSAIKELAVADASDFALWLAENVVQSFGTLWKGSPKVMERALQSGAVGAGVGTAIPAIGTAAGGMTGAGYGYIVGMGEQSANVEYANTFINTLAESGVDITDEKSLKEALNNENLIKEAKKKAMLRGVPVGFFDGLSAGIGGKIVTQPGKSAFGKMAKALAEPVVQAGLGGAGAAAGQLASEGKITDGKEIFTEIVAEFGTSPVEILTGSLRSNKLKSENKPYTVSKNKTELFKIFKGATKEEIDFELARQVSLGKITEEQKQMMSDLIMSMNEADKVTPQGIPNREEAVVIVSEKKELEKEAENVDTSFQPIIDQQISEKIKELEALTSGTTTTPTVSEPIQPTTATPQEQGVEETVSESVSEVGDGTAEATTTVLEPLSSVEATAKALEGKSIGKEIERFENEGRKGEFFAPKGEGYEGYGKNKKSAIILPFAKIKTIRDSISYIRENNLTEIKDKELSEKLGSKTWQEAEGRMLNEDYGNATVKGIIEYTNLFYSELQKQVKNDILSKNPNIDIIEFKVEDETNPNQFWVLNKDVVLENSPKAISEAYHKAKADGSNPELVKAVEELLTPKIEQDAKITTEQPSSQMREQSVQETTERTSDSDMPIVNEAELQDRKTVEEEVSVEVPDSQVEANEVIEQAEERKVLRGITIGDSINFNHAGGVVNGKVTDIVDGKFKALEADGTKYTVKQKDVIGKQDVLSKLENLKIKGGDQTGALMLAPKIYNTFLDIVIAGVKAGKLLSEAIAKGIDYLKSENVADIQPYIDDLITKVPEIKTQAKDLINALNVNVRDIQKKARKINHVSFNKAVKDFASINPNKIPTSILPDYIKALDTLTSRAPRYQDMIDLYYQIQSANTPKDRYSNIKSFADAETAWEKIWGNEIKSVEDYRSLFKDINSLKRNLGKLLENGDITEEQYNDIITEIGIQQQQVEQKFESEISQLKIDLINEIRTKPISNNSEFTAEENAIIDKFNELNNNDLRQLSPENLFVLNELINNIENGEIDLFRFNDILSKAYTIDAGKQVAEQTSKSELLKGKKVINEQEIRDNISEQESAFWEGLLGLGRRTSGAFQKFIISPFQRAISSYEKEIKDGYDAFLKAKKKYNISDKQMDKIGIVATYLQEYMAQYNPKWKNTKDIGKRDWFKAILETPSMKAKYPAAAQTTWEKIRTAVGFKPKSQIELIEEIWKSLPKDANGNVNPEAVYNSYMANDGKFLTKNEKAFFEEMTKWKEDNITDKQRAANEFKGNPFEETPFHMMRIRFSDAGQQVAPKATGESGNVRIEAGTGKERTSQKIEAIETNYEKAFIKGLEQTARDYHLTKMLQDVNNTLATAKKNADESTKPIINAMSNILSDALNFEFDKKGVGNSFRTLMQARAALTLFDPERTLRELLSSAISYPIRSKTPQGYKQLFGGQKTMRGLLEFTESPLRLRENINKAVDVEDGKITPASKFEKATIYLSGFPERAMMVTAWMPTFNNEFETLTGNKFSSESFNTNKTYREKYGKQIKEAAAVADAQTEKIIGSTTKAGQRKKVKIAPKVSVDKDSPIGQILGFFSNYPYREINEFVNGFKEAAEAIRSGDGSVSAAKQLMKPLGITLNVAAYGYLSNLAFNIIAEAIGTDDEKEKAKEELESLTTLDGFLQDLGGNMASLAAAKYSGGGRALMQTAATIAYANAETKEEKAKIKKWLKDTIYLDPLPLEDVSGYGGKDKANAALARYVPQFAVISDRLIDTMGGVKEIQRIYQKIEESGVESLTNDEQQRLLVLDVMIKSAQLIATANGTSLPMYNKLKMFMRGELEDAGYSEKKKQSTNQQGSTLGRVIETTDRQATERQTNERQATSRQAE